MNPSIPCSSPSPASITTTRPAPPRRSPCRPDEGAPMTDPDARGTTRRALLRNTALGVSALAGGAALVTADAAEAGAATSHGEMFLSLDGVRGPATSHGLPGA